MRLGREQGSVLVEAALSLSLLILPSFALSLEAIRVAQYQAVFHHTVFRYTRLRALGLGKSEARAVAGVSFKSALSDGEAKRLVRYLDWEEQAHIHFLRGRVRYRFPSFFPFLKDRIQVTRTCPFLWSR